MNKLTKTLNGVGSLIMKFPGEWVTLSSNKKEVLGHSKRMETALNQAYKTGETEPFLIKAPDGNTAAYIY